MASEHVILEALNEAEVLKAFLSLCEKHSSVDSRQRLRNIFSRTNDPVKATQIIATRELDVSLSCKDAARLHELLCAYLHKSNYRKTIPDSVRIKLLHDQGFKCAICGCTIDSHAHADHVVPFKYVGDELEGNLQMLCSSCNTKKNASLFYQIQYLLGLV